MPPEESPSGGEKKRPHLWGIGGLPPAYDIGLRWGLTLAIAVLIGFFAGRWLDLKLGTTPLFLLIGIFWGVGGAFYSLVLQLKKLQEEEERKAKEESDSR